MLRNSLWICLSVLLGLSAELLRADSIWVHEVIVSDIDGLILTTNVRYWVDGSRIDYEFQLTNQTGRDIWIPPLKDETRPPYLGIEPFYDIYLKIDGSWKHYVKNKRLEGRWEKHESRLSYYSFFTTALLIKPDTELKFKNGVDFRRFNEIPSLPEKIRIIFPFKAGGEENTVTYEIEPKSVAGYICLLKTHSGRPPKAAVECAR